MIGCEIGLARSSHWLVCLILPLGWSTTEGCEKRLILILELDSTVETLTRLSYLFYNPLPIIISPTFRPFPSPSPPPLPTYRHVPPLP
jgi:hypothetical protein